jgi:hypothetical protein
MIDNWRKSSFTHTQNCVEVRGDLTALRDTKDRKGPVLRGSIFGLVEFAKRVV